MLGYCFDGHHNDEAANTQAVDDASLRTELDQVGDRIETLTSLSSGLAGKGAMGIAESSTCWFRQSTQLTRQRYRLLWRHQSSESEEEDDMT